MGKTCSKQKSVKIRQDLSLLKHIKSSNTNVDIIEIGETIFENQLIREIN